jgi:hypothetical protein
LGGSVIAVGGEVRGGAENLCVSVGEFFVVGGGEEIDVAARERFEECEGDFFVVGEARVDDVKESDLGVEGAERPVRFDGESESIRPRAVHLGKDGVVLFAAEPFGELFAIGLGEAGKGGL